MARIRTIKPEFFRHEGLFEVEQETGLPVRLAFAGLWTVADREGRFAWRPRVLKLDALPHDSVDFAQILDALARHGFVVKYEIDGLEYGFIPSWRSHQMINARESESKIPAPNNTNQVHAHDKASAKQVQAQAEKCGQSVDKSTISVDNHDQCMHVHACGEGEGKGREREGKGNTPAVLTSTEIPPRTNSLAAAAGAALENLRATPSTADDPGRRGELHAVCAANNVRANAMHPQLVEWAKADVTVEQLREAIAQARIHKPPPESLNPAYLAPIVDRVRQGKKPDPNSAWAVDDDAAIAKGREIGVKAKPGEDFHAYRQRLRDELQRVGRRAVA